MQLKIKAIRGLDVKPYTHYPHENELLLDPHARFRVVDYKLTDNKLRVELLQIA